jgi:uncharacterized membrane protein YjgN (DUF898 family)
MEDLTFEEGDDPKVEQAEDAKEDVQTSEKSSDPNKENFLSYDGRAGKIFKISLLNFFLTIITIGIYRFWGKTRMRRYLVSCFILDNDRFEYTGTGGELFKGFLKAFPFILVLMLPIAIFGEENPAVLLLYVPLYYLFGVAIYGALRYRYSRTRWRGIRCILRGSMIEYANLSIIRTIINIFTLGFAIPYSDIKKHRYIIENSYFGSVNAEYQGNARRIYKAYLLSLVLTPFMVVPGSLLFALPAILAQSGAGAEPGILAFLSGFLGMMIIMISVTFARAFYTAALLREKTRGIIAGDVRFRCDVTAWEITKFQIVNILILFCTLGLGFAFVIQRKMEFIAYHYTIIGDLDTSDILQGDEQGITSGEGLEDALDLDIGLF